MTEILTESFCERCGTRYTFESAAPRRSRLGRVRTVSKGLKNFVLSDETTFSEAMADARSDLERSATASQLDAFHRTFNFCLTCRQYTCGNCWNTAEGRCLTCIPLPGMEASDDLMAVQPIAFVEPTNGFHDHDEALEPIGPEAWPEADLDVERLDQVMAAGAIAAATDVDELPAADEAVDGERAAETGVVFDAELADEAPVAAEAGEAPVELDEDAVVARIAGVAPGQSVEDAVAAYEAQVAAEEAQRAHEVELAAIVAAAAAADHEEPAEARIEPEAEPVAAEAAQVETEPEAVVAEAEAEPVLVAEAEPEADHDALAAAAALAVVAEPEAEPIAIEAAEAEPVLVAEAEPEADHDALAAAAALAVVTEPEAEPEPEPVAAAPEDDHHGLAAAAALAAMAAPDVHTEVPAPAAAPREDVVAQPTWPVAPAAPPAAPAPTPIPAPAQPEAPAQPANPWLTVAPDEGNQPQWPAAPIWGQPAAGRRGAPATLAGRALLPQDDAASIWAASAAEVLNGTAKAPQPVAAPNLTPQPCISCGLSLSANARFCRRCGTRQG